MTRIITIALILFGLGFLTSCETKPKAASNNTSTSSNTNTSNTSNNTNSNTNTNSNAGNNANSNASNTGNSTAATNTNANTSGYDSPMSALAQVLKDCNKVEYLMYDFGITFETPSAAEVARFYGFIDDAAADETNCTKNKYDGSVVFKNEEGDIKLGMEFNVLKNCHRVVFQLDGKTYSQRFNQRGLDFFKQILSMQQQQLKKAQGGGQ